MDNTDTDRVMTIHLTDDELVLHYYGEMTPSEEAQRRRAPAVVPAMPGRSAQAAARAGGGRRERTGGTRVAGAFRAHRLGTPRAESRSGTRGGWASWFLLSPGRLAWMAMVVLLVGAAFMAGRLLPRSPGRRGERRRIIRERIMLVDLGEHLDRSQMMLVELVSADDETAVDISGERTRAEQLVAANRLYRQTAHGDRRYRASPICSTSSNACWWTSPPAPRSCRPSG